MTVFEAMRKRLLQRAGILPRDKAPLEGVSFDELRARECGDGFADLMDNRIVMGHLRYGPMQSEKPLFHDVLKAKACLAKYVETGNTELLVDAANYCRCEFRRGRHPNKHFHAVDRT